MFPPPPARSQYSVLIRARVRVAVRACSPLVALLQVKNVSCCFNTNMNSLQNFEYFEFKHIVRKKKWRLWHRTVFSRDTCWWPTRHHYLSNPGGGGGGLGGWSHARTWPGHPPVSTTCRRCLQLAGRVYLWCTVSIDPDPPSPCVRVNNVSGPSLGEGGVRPPSQILALGVYNMPTVSTISRPCLLVVHSVYRPRPALPLCAGKRC